MRVTIILLVSAVVSLQVSGPIIAAWTMNKVSDVTPGGTIACSGDAIISASYQVTISYKVNDTVTDLTSHSGTTHYMQNDWSKEFDPSTDYNPPSSWPVTGNSSTKIMKAKLVAGSTEVVKYFECNTAP